MDLPNRADLFEVGRRYVRTAPNTRINPDLVDVAGSDINLVVGSGSLMTEAAVAAFARCARGMFAETARGSQLDVLAGDRYSLPRLPETPAGVSLVLARPTAAAGGGTIPAGFRVQTADGTAYSLDADAVFGALDLVNPSLVTATALEAGPESNAPAGAIVSFLDEPFDATIIPSNPTPAAGGAPAETDPQFRGRIAGFFRALRRGTIGAIQFGSLVPSVAVATAFEIVNPGDSLPAGAAQVVIGDRDGNATPQMIQAVKNALIEWRCCGIPVFVTGGLVVEEPVSWRLTYRTGIDTVAAQEDVRAVSVAISQFIPAGFPLRRSDLIAAARTVPGVIVSEGSLVAPAGDVFPTDNFHLVRVAPAGVSFLT